MNHPPPITARILGVAVGAFAIQFPEDEIRFVEIRTDCVVINQIAYPVFTIQACLVAARREES